ncbi:MAG: hypothetical protein GWP91_04230 [Rhodobacterales bacterium]|nr:hypothetical protein [Rhodobacterales bacterium]
MRVRLTVVVLALVGCGKSSVPADIDPQAQLVEHGVQTCANPEVRQTAPFTRETAPAPPNTDLWLWGGALIVADLNNDGLHDIVLPNEITRASIFLGTGTNDFEERVDILDSFDLSRGTGGSAADYDGDGDLDLYIARYDLPNVLLRNDGDLLFTDVTDFAGVNGCDNADADCFRTMSTSWADFDADGDLDLMVSNYGFVVHDGRDASQMTPGEPSFLYRNNGDGTFSDATPELLPYDEFDAVHDGYTYVGSFIDLDGDLLPELYFINDFGSSYPNVLLRNVNGVYERDYGELGLDVIMTGMGLGVGDTNEDGLPDLFIPEWNGLRLLESYRFNSTIGWLDTQASQLGLRVAVGLGQKVGWGGSLADMDLDGRLDAVVAYGFIITENEIWDNPWEQPDGLYLQDASGGFSDVGSEWRISETGVGRGYATADFNNDGYLDLAKRDLNGPEVLFMSQCGSEAWLRINLRRPDTLNTYAVGARVKVVSNGDTQTRWMMAGGLNYNSAPPLELHFGLGTVPRVDELEITWPDGRVSRFTDVSTRQILTVTQDLAK